MSRLSFFVSLALALSSLPSGLAGPACARKNFQVADCVSKCKSKWGWTGSMMGTDPWGSVVQNMDTTKNWDNVIAKACGSSVAAATSTTSTIMSTSTAPASSTAVVPPSTSSAVSTSPNALSSSSRVSSSSTSVKHTSSPAVNGFVASVRSTPAAAAPTQRLTTSTRPAPAPTNTPAPAPPKTTAAALTKAAPPASPPASGGSGSTSNADIQSYLSAHNSIRSAHGAAPLSWSNSLASTAQTWANRCQFVHSGGSLGPFGENLAAGTGDDYGIATAIKSWTDEVSSYNPSNPSPSHFTQVVWKGSSQVGCAVQSCDGIFDASFGKAKYFVCEYSAQGNIIGQFAQNVQV